MVEILTSRLTRRWQSGLVGGSPSRIFSPFVTSNTAERVLGHLGVNCELYTVFSPDNFVTGASSIGCLRRLARAGCHIYHVEGLHAKVTLGGPEFATIGSQNLTAGGEQHKEMNVVLSSADQVSAIASAVEPWIAERVRVTLEDIELMEKLIHPYRRKFLALTRELKGEGFQIADIQEARAASLRNKRVAKLQRALRDPQSREFDSKYGQVKWVDTNYGANSNCTLLAVDGFDLTWWHIKGESIDLDRHLDRLNRYLCLNESDGRIGWGRVGETRITKFGLSVIGVRTLKYQDMYFPVDMHANPSIDSSSPQNGTIVLKGVSSGERLRLHCWFSVSDLKIIRVLHLDENGTLPLSLRRLEGALTQNSKAVRNRLRQLILKPFRYEHNLIGQEANRFFGEIDTRWRLRLFVRNEIPFLVVSPSL